MMERTAISDLPVEIFIKIFEKLESPEIFKIAEVCRHWYLITQHAAIVSKTIVQLGQLGPHSSQYKFNSENIDFFLNSSRKFQFRVTISQIVLPDNYCQFIQKFYENIIEFRILHGMMLLNREHFNIKLLKNLRYLELYFCNIHSSLTNFTSNIVNMKSLKDLTLINCSFEIESILPDDLQLNLTSLKLETNKTNVYTLLSTIPNLKILSVHYNVFNSIETVFKYLKNTKLTKSLTELNLECFDNDVHEDICQMNHLNLKKFQCGNIFNAGRLEKFLSNQMNLETLVLSRVVVNDKMLQSIFKNLLNLQELRFLFCYECEITDFGITGNPQGFSITRLEKLKLFSLKSYRFANITNASIRLMESMKHLEKVDLPKSLNYSSNDSRFNLLFPF